MLNNNTIELTSIDFISDNIARCTHKKKLSTLIYLENRNIVVASFVTAYARLELYKLLDKIGENVLYFDTDSVLFVFDVTKLEKIETGNFLGELTNELVKKNCSEIWIMEFCSTGPKCYSYITKKYENFEENMKEREEVVHIKGFSLTNKDVRENSSPLSHFR